MNNWYSQFVRRFSAHMERTKLHETENIGMSLKGKRIVILAARPDWIFGFSPPQILRVKNAVEVLAHHWICGHALRLGRGATFEDPTGVGLNQNTSWFGRHSLDCSAGDNFRQLLVSSHNLLTRSTHWRISAIKRTQLRHKLPSLVLP